MTIKAPKKSGAAACATTPDRHIYESNCTTSYAALSSLKLFVGELLLLQTLLSGSEQQIDWRLFEAKLRRFVDFKYSGGSL